MGRKKSASENINELITQYETSKAENRLCYLDGDQFADIVCQYIFENKIQEAQEAINYGLYIHPNNIDILIEQAYLYLDTQRLQLAEEIADSIIEDYSVEVKLLKAEILLHKGKLKAVQELLNTINDQIDLDVIISIAYLYMDMGYPEEARIWLEKGKEQYGNEEDFLVVSVDYLLATHQYSSAVDLYNQLIDLNPYNSSYWIGLSKCHFVEDNIEEAIEDCDFALTADEQYGEAYAHRAHCYFYIGNPEKAIDDYKKAIKYKGIAPQVGYWLIGMVYQDQEQWEKAETYFKESIQIYLEKEETDPFIAEVYTHTAEVLLRQNKPDEAYEMCQKALQIEPDLSNVALIKGEIFLKKRQYEKAFDTFTNILNDSQDPEKWYDIGLIYEEAGEFNRSMFFYNKVYEIDPDYNNVSGKLAVICLAEGDMENFLKYNRMARYPISSQVISQVLSDQTNLSQVATELLKKMQKQIEKRDNNQ